MGEVEDDNGNWLRQRALELAIGCRSPAEFDESTLARAQAFFEFMTKAA